MIAFSIKHEDIPQLGGRYNQFMDFMKAEYPNYVAGSFEVQAHDEDDLLWFVNEYLKKAKRDKNG
jgi:hypothetical protein